MSDDLDGMIAELKTSPEAWALYQQALRRDQEATSARRMEAEMSDYSGSDRVANAGVRFLPAVTEEDNSGQYAPPCLEIAGMQVYVYVRDGTLVVSLDSDTADVGVVNSPFAVHDTDGAPVVVNVDGNQVWSGIL